MKNTLSSIPQPRSSNDQFHDVANTFSLIAPLNTNEHKECSTSCSLDPFPFEVEEYAPVPFLLAPTPFCEISQTTSRSFRRPPSMSPLQYPRPFLSIDTSSSGKTAKHLAPCEPNSSNLSPNMSNYAPSSSNVSPNWLNTPSFGFSTAPNTPNLFQPHTPKSSTSTPAQSSIYIPQVSPHEWPAPPSVVIDDFQMLSLTDTGGFCAMFQGADESEWAFQDVKSWSIDS
jgi:hypothetical protein